MSAVKVKPLAWRAETTLPWARWIADHAGHHGVHIVHQRDLSSPFTLVSHVGVATDYPTLEAAQAAAQAEWEAFIRAALA